MIIWQQPLHSRTRHFGKWLQKGMLCVYEREAYLRTYRRQKPNLWRGIRPALYFGMILGRLACVVLSLLRFFRKKNLMKIIYLED